eukprot:CAMPEP_0118934252 /NCGR_PEP_ID=MMETSP1169-20130426/13720_1 /TAXON_ID=36882 /ORGANISM="Pyramimonas obovata, Strain CCMP722" /LENGTH=137 /DNA_ID=CAMNT_0006877133 /DNA_START=183 /DNA_END=596 /DNA_ORIENTATION=-
MALQAPFATNVNNDRYIPVPAPQSEGAKGNGKAAYGAIYHTYSKPPTPIKHGMRPAAGAFEHYERPYAQDNVNVFQEHPTFCPLPSNVRKTRPPDPKVGVSGYNSVHYSESAASTKLNSDIGRYRGYIGGGKILYHD